MLIRKFTRNGRDEAMAAAVVRALEPRFEAIDRRFEAIDDRFEAMDVKWERRFEAIERRFEAIERRFEDIDLRFGAMDNRFGTIDVKWERRFVELRNEISGFRGQSVDVREHVAHLQQNVDAQLKGFDARLNQMGKEIAKQFDEKFAALSATVVHGFDRPQPT
ncbi:hypothetical protein [Candidatus Palauibacter sp.]|uniref:hypothetical protein n=1 Tax=Candidatus Palauibacter sp. TaxID=3101350 RepID=UPI003B025CAF